MDILTWFFESGAPLWFIITGMAFAVTIGFFQLVKEVNKSFTQAREKDQSLTSQLVSVLAQTSSTLKEVADSITLHNADAATRNHVLLTEVKAGQAIMKKSQIDLAALVEDSNGQMLQAVSTAHAERAEQLRHLQNSVTDLKAELSGALSRIGTDDEKTREMIIATEGRLTAHIIHLETELLLAIQSIQAHTTSQQGEDDAATETEA